MTLCGAVPSSRLSCHPPLPSTGLDDLPELVLHQPLCSLTLTSFRLGTQNIFLGVTEVAKRRFDFSRLFRHRHRHRHPSPHSGTDNQPVSEGTQGTHGYFFMSARCQNVVDRYRR